MKPGIKTTELGAVVILALLLVFDLITVEDARALGFPVGLYAGGRGVAKLGHYFNRKAG